MTIAIVLWILAVLVVNVVPYVPTHDGPQHIYVGHIVNRFSDVDSIYPAYYRPTQPFSALGFSLVFGPLDDLFGWKIAFRVSLSVIVSLWGWGMWALAHAISPPRVVIAVTGFALAFQWSFYMGFFSWMISAAFGMFCLAVAVRGIPWTPLRRCILASLLFVQAGMHVFPAQTTGLVLIALVITHYPPRAWFKELGLLALMGVPVMLLVAYASGLLGGQSVDLPSETASVRLGWSDRASFAYRMFAGGPVWRSLPVLVLAVFGATFGLWGWVRGRATVRDRALWIGASLLAMAFALTPVHLDRWQFFSPRFLAPSIVLFLLLVPVERLSWNLQRAVFALSGVFTAAALGWTAWFHLDMHRRTSDVQAALADPIRRTGPRLPIIIDTLAGHGPQLHTWYPFFEPAFNLGVLFAIEQGGTVPYTFTSVPQLHGVVLTDEGLERMPPAPHRQRFAAILRATRRKGDAAGYFATLTRYASFGAQFDDVILYARDTEHEVFASRGYRVDAQHGGVRILRFEGCPIEVSVRASSPISHPVTVEYSWHPVTQPSWQVTIPAGTIPRDGVVTAKLDRTPCGLILLRVWSDDNDSGGWDEGDRMGEARGPRDARSDGRRVVELRTGVEEIRCTLVDMPRLGR